MKKNIKQRQSMSELKKKKVFRWKHLTLEEDPQAKLRFPETIHAKPTCQ